MQTLYLKVFSTTVFVSLFFNQTTSEDIVVRTNLGLLVGKEFATSLNRTVNSFLGLPFAKPPVGELRFEEPEPIGKWDGKWLATQSSSMCLQMTLQGNPRGNEDCLYLDIYTPHLAASSFLPVLVYFHGGTFRFGKGSLLKPYFLMDNADFVYVSVNYRLGSLGFLSTEDDVVPGNNGLKDQVMALRWVQENIDKFGGNKNEVTIAGHSAGGASVHLHFMSPLSRGLFNKGVSMSGSALSHWALSKRPLQKAKGLANALDCPTHTTQRMVQCLRERPGPLLVSYDHLFQAWHSSPFTIFGPVVENSKQNSFLLEHPYKTMAEGRAFDGPLMVSVTTEDGLYPGFRFVGHPERLAELDDNWLRIAPHLMDYNFTATSDRDNVSSRIRNPYVDKEAFSERNTHKIIEMLTDRIYKVDISKAAILQAANYASDVFFYVFSYRGSKHAIEGQTETKKDFGVSHGEDLNYVFGFNQNLGSTGPPFESDGDRAMARVMQGVWMNFLQTGNPIGVTEDKLHWTSQPKGSDNSSLHYLLINNASSFTMNTNPNFGNSRFWNSLEFDENENYNDPEDHFMLRNGSANEQFALIVIWIISMLLLYFSVD